MQKSIDIKNRIVDLTDVNTGDNDPQTGKRYEDLIVEWLNKKMRVCFHSVILNNSTYVFTGNPKDRIHNAITVSGYRNKQPGERTSIDINPNY